MVAFCRKSKWLLPLLCNYDIVIKVLENNSIYLSQSINLNFFLTFCNSQLLNVHSIFFFTIQISIRIQYNYITRVSTFIKVIKGTQIQRFAD